MKPNVSEKTKFKGKIIDNPIELFWEIIAPKSGTLILCRDIDNSLLVIQEICQELALWKSQLVLDNHLPLSQLSRFSTILGKLCRTRIQLTGNVANLVQQVRSMFTGSDSSNPRCLEREMELVRTDRLLFLEGKIEKLNSDLTNAALASRSKRANLGWKHFVTEILNAIEGSRVDETQKQIFEFVSSLKKADRKAISERVSQQTIKHKNKPKHFSSQEMAPERDSKREEVVSSSVIQTASLELQDWQHKMELESNSIAEERRILSSQRELLLNEQSALAKSKQQFESMKHKSNLELIHTAQSLAEKERLVNARFPELSEIESYVKGLLQKLDSSANRVMSLVTNPEEMDEIRETSLKSIAYADLKLKTCSADDLKDQMISEHFLPQLECNHDFPLQNELILPKDPTASDPARSLGNVELKDASAGVTGWHESSNPELAVMLNETSRAVETFLKINRDLSSPTSDPHVETLNRNQIIISPDNSSATCFRDESFIGSASGCISALQNLDVNNHNDGSGKYPESVSGTIRKTYDDSSVSFAGETEDMICGAVPGPESRALPHPSPILSPPSMVTENSCCVPSHQSTAMVGFDAYSYQMSEDGVSGRLEGLEKIYRIAIEIEDKVEKTIAVLLQSDAQMKVIVAH